MPDYPMRYSPNLDEVRAACQRWSNAFLQEKLGTSDLKKFDPKQYVPRSSIEAQVTQFTDDPAAGLVLVGPSGAGKTTLFCTLAQKLINEGHLVLLHDSWELGGSQSAGRDGGLRASIESTIAEELGTSRELLPSFLTLLNRRLSEEGKCLFLFFDAIEKYTLDGSGVYELLAAINALLRAWDIQGLSRVKVLMSCLDTAWDRLPTAQMLSWDRYFTPKKYYPLVLDRYTEDEFKLAYEKYIGATPEANPDLFKRVKDLCEDDPFTLKLASLLNITELEDLSADDLFKGYYQAKILNNADAVGKDGYLKFFTEKLLEKQRDEIRTNELDTRDPVFQSLLNEGILTVTEFKSEDPFPQPIVQLSHSRLATYLLTAHLHRTYGRDMPVVELIALVDKASRGFFSLWRAIAEYLGGFGNEDWFIQLASSPNYDHQEMAFSGLKELARRPRARATQVLKRLFQTELARPVALRAALELHGMPDVRAEFGQWIREQPAQVATYIRILWKEYQDTKLGDAIWDELDAIRDEQMKPSVLVESITSGNSYNLLASVTWRIFLDDCHDPKSVAHLSRFWLSTWQLLLNDPRLPGGEIRVMGSIVQPVRSFMFVRKIKPGIREFANERTGRFLKQFASPDSDPEKARKTEKWPNLPIFPDEMRQVARLLDWDAEPGRFERSRAAVLHLLGSKLLPQNRMQVATAAMAAAIQSLRDFERAQPTLEYLFESGNRPARLALLTAFSVYALGPARDTLRQGENGERLVAMLYSMTKRLLIEDPGYLTDMDDPWRVTRKYNMTLALAPLGFTFCNLSDAPKQPIRPIADLIREMGAQGDDALFGSFIKGLASVGIFFPDETLATLEFIRAFDATDEHVIEAIKETLRVIQVFHATKVPDFLRQRRGQIKSDFMPERLLGRPLDKILDYTQWIGNLNFLYHVAHFPMLRCLLQGTLIGLSTTEGTCEQVVDRAYEILVDELFKKEVSMEKVLHDPVEDPEAIIRKIAGKGYLAP